MLDRRATRVMSRAVECARKYLTAHQGFVKSAQSRTNLGSLAFLARSPSAYPVCAEEYGWQWSAAPTNEEDYSMYYCMIPLLCPSYDISPQA
jgi:hypothetical protein